ncbi:MAG: glycosyltransferase family 39 protein [Nanoarchaeota archaeon]
MLFLMIGFFGRRRTFVIILFLILLLMLSSTRTDNLGDWDEANHASSSLFVYNFVKDWFKNPTFSFDELKQRAVDYHARYKYFTVLFIYPPMDLMFSVFIYIFFGVSVLTTNLATIIEAILVLFFVYKLSKLFFGIKNVENDDTEDKKEKDWDIFPAIAVLLVAFNAIFFTVAIKNYIDIMLMLFMLASAYFFIRFLKKDDTFYLYLFAISLAFGILSKQLMIFMIPVFVIVFIWEKKIKGIKEHGKSILKSFALFMIFLIPLWIQLGLLLSQGLFDIYLRVWYFNPSVGGAGLDSFLPALTSATVEKLFLNTSLLFYQWFIVPLFLIGLYYVIKRHNESDKILVLSILLFFYLFLVKIQGNSLARLMMLLAPFVAIITVKGLIEMKNWSKSEVWKGLYVLIIILIVAASMFQTFTFNQAIISSYPAPDDPVYPTTTDFSGAAVFLSEEMKAPATVITTFGHMQMFEFAQHDTNRYITSMYAPYTKEDWEKALVGDYSYRASEELWQSYGIEYGVPKYAVIHERQLLSGQFKYDIDYLLSDSRFELIKTINGDQEGDKTFIFKIAAL